MRHQRNDAAVNPKNMDAVREVRLHTLRAGDEGDKKRLLGKLFDK